MQMLSQNSDAATDWIKFIEIVNVLDIHAPVEKRYDNNLPLAISYCNQIRNET